MSSTMLDAALDYCDRGLRVFPLIPRGKIGLTKHGSKDATADPETIAAWWARHPTANVGLATGAGLAVLDVDGPEGAAALAALEAEHGPLPTSTWVTLTARGRHIWFTCTGHTIKNAQGKPDRPGPLGPGLDVRGKGGHVCAPPSIHETGAVYRWMPGCSPAELELPAEIPGWLLEKLLQRRKSKPATPARAAKRSSSNGASGGSPYGIAALTDELGKVRAASGGSRHDTLNRAAFACGQLIGGGELERGQVEAALRDAAGSILEEVGREAEVSRTIRDGIEAGMGEPRSARDQSAQRQRHRHEQVEVTDNDEAATLPQIRLSADPTEVSRSIEIAIAALADRYHGELFVRGGMLVSIVRDARPPRGVQRPPEAPVLTPLGEGRLLEMLATSALWLKYSPKADWYPVLPPGSHAKMIRDRGTWPGIPRIDAIVEAPSMRPDGTLLDAPGHDDETDVLAIHRDTFPTIPGRPTRGNAESAVTELCRPFSEFPWRSDVDRAAFLAALLTVLARPAIDGPVPLFAITGNAPGVGKSRLADCIARIATGRDAARATLPTDDTETRKLLFALAIEGGSLLLLDNASGAVGSDALAAAVTSSVVRDRVLGASKTATVPLLGVTMLTGNELTFRRDLGRRVVLCELVAQIEHPEDRTGWAIPDLLAHVREHRGELVAAGLTVLRAYHVAGRPGHGRPPRGGFESWDGLIRGALVWAGAGDACGNLHELRARADADLEALRGALTSWYQRFGSRPVTAADAVAAAGHDEVLRTGLAEVCGRELSGKSLGYALRRYSERIVGGLRFVRRDKGELGARWAVEVAP